MEKSLLENEIHDVTSLLNTITVSLSCKSRTTETEKTLHEKSDCHCTDNLSDSDVIDHQLPHLKSDFHLPEKFCGTCLIESPLKNDEKCFLFHLTSSFRSQDIQVFVTASWPCRKNGLIRKISLTLKFITSQPGLQTVAIHILPNMSQSKGNQTMKFGQLIEYNKRNCLLQKLGEK